MSVWHPITIQFAVKDFPFLKEIARDHASSILSIAQSDAGHLRTVLSFLTEVGEDPRKMLDVFTWGGVTRRSDLGEFTDPLMRPFWSDLYDRHAMDEFHGIVMMMQSKFDYRMHCVEITRDMSRPKAHGIALTVRSLTTTFPLFADHFERPSQLLPRGVDQEIWTSEPKEGNL